MTRDSDDSTASAGGRLNTARLHLPGMNCPWNARRSADYLQRLDGVVETSVPRSDAVVVRYDPNRTSEAAVTAAVERPESADDPASSLTRSNRQSAGCRCGCRMR